MIVVSDLKLRTVCKIGTNNILQYADNGHKERELQTTDQIRIRA